MFLMVSVQPEAREGCTIPLAEPLAGPSPEPLRKTNVGNPLPSKGLPGAGWGSQPNIGMGWDACLGKDTLDPGADLDFPERSCFFPFQLVTEHMGEGTLFILQGLLLVKGGRRGLLEHPTCMGHRRCTAQAPRTDTVGGGVRDPASHMFCAGARGLTVQNLAPLVLIRLLEESFITALPLPPLSRTDATWHC